MDELIRLFRHCHQAPLNDDEPHSSIQTLNVDATVRPIRRNVDDEARL